MEKTFQGFLHIWRPKPEFAQSALAVVDGNSIFRKGPPISSARRRNSATSISRGTINTWVVPDL